MKRPVLEPYDEEDARRIAHIVGPSSAVGKALADMKARRERGERPALFRDLATDMIVVINMDSLPAEDTAS